MITGVITAPNDPPEYDTAIPRDLFSGGKVCTTVRKLPGNVAPSPNPNTARAAAKPCNPNANTCDTDASVQIETAAVIPALTPMRSRMYPHKGFPSM